MPFCGDATWWSKFSFLLLFLAISIHSAGIGTPYWMKLSTLSNSVNLMVGLWKMVDCSGGVTVPCYGVALTDNYNTGLMTITRVLECIPIVTIIFALILSMFYVSSPGVRTQKVAVWIMMSSFISMALIVGGCIAWWVNMPSKHFVHWSFGLASIAAAVCMLSGVLMIPDIRMYDYEDIKAKRKAKQRRRVKKENKMAKEKNKK